MPKKNTKKKKENPKQIFIHFKNNKTPFFLGLICLLFMFFVIWFLYGKFFFGKNISALLPKEKTILLFEIKDHNKLSEIGINKDAIKDLINNYFAVDFDTDIKTWIGKKAAFSIIHHNRMNNEVFFFEIGDKKNALKFFQKLGLKNEELEKVYYRKFPVYYFPFSQKLYISFINRYAVVSPKKSVINLLIDQYYKESRENLNAETKFNTIRNNIQKNNIVFMYANTEALKENTLIVSHYAYVFDVLTDIGVSVDSIRGKTNIKSFLSIDKEHILDNDFFSTPEKYKNSLAGYISPKNLIFYIGGQNFEKQTLASFQLMKSFNPTFALIMKGIIDRQLSLYVGENIDFEKDILSLFKNEYAVYAGVFDNKIKVSFILEQKENIETRLVKILDAYEKLKLYLTPVEKKRELPDGTIYSELVIDESKIRSVDETYDGFSIKGKEISDAPYGLYYTFIENKLVVSTWMRGVIDIIDTYQKKTPSLLDDPKYSESMKNITLDGNEISYMDLKGIKESIPEEIRTYLDPESFNTFMVMKKFFSDGISVEAVID